MSYNSDDLEVRIRFRGGSGNAATWDWNVYLKGAGLPLRSGQVKGTKAKAEIAAEQAKQELASAS